MKKAFIVKIPRNNPFFGQPIELHFPEGSEIIEKPKNLILCDVCSSKIETEEIYCASFTYGRSIWGTYCEACRLKYQAQLPIYTVEEVQEMMK